ncbi:50S ribosomal protein L3 N(5)-glutamine methyltransferase [Bowmanella dokdonensis]|uniref:Ribosomal protein uL3 glutamine methyltransferase n=1 Tax=Bowmanella dokdonensis TaxID=751969 RepID=A0A939IQZ4_9ALTE|nr:50S ribosomal protein L3 N(5)-glutamine methyltransferase [Bowmanella dokdonensis]MBN7827445.1 50S ribosomal protein L3 N(5)-glutamine methyltransferase [Bowmanella dokdonensis]
MTDDAQWLDATGELHTLLDWLRWTASRFNEAELYFGHGTDNAWDEAVSLVLHVLHLPHQDPMPLFAARLTSTEKQQVLELVTRRVKDRVPLAYLTHQAWFCGLPFYVDERVLVPRSPFAELINSRFEPWLGFEPENILDMCTGSACIAIACAYAWPDAQVDAVDISAEALQVAEINIQEHGLNEQVFPILSDGYGALKGQRYDLIIANPPYVDEEDMADLPEEFHHEPELGLAAGHDGLDLVHRLLRDAPDHLSEKGWLFVEVGNSMVHMQARYPTLPLSWIDFERGGLGVFAISRRQLVEYLYQQQAQETN